MSRCIFAWYFDGYSDDSGIGEAVRWGDGVALGTNDGIVDNTAL